MRQPVKRVKLYETIKQDIARGIYLPGSFLPNELDLVKKYGHARDTVRLALALLEDEKIIELKKNKGRQVRPANVEKVQVPLTFLLPCPDFLSETFANVSVQNNRRIFKGVSQTAFEYDSRVETVPVSPTNSAHDIDWRKLDFVNANSMLVVFNDWYRALFPLGQGPMLERGCRMAFIYSHLSHRQEDEEFINRSFCISINSFGAMETAVEYLFKQGRRRIALFHCHISEPGHPIMKGYLSGIKKCGLKFAACHEYPTEPLNLEIVKSQLKDFYKKSGGFDSLVIDSGLVVELRLHNLHHYLGLAEDIKIIVSGDTDNNQWVTPSLTSMVFPYEEVGRIAAQHLLSPDFSPGEQVINGRLSERESTLNRNLNFALA